MSQDLKFTLVDNFKCKRCGCIHYDKMIYTGLKTLEDDDSIVHEVYVCRNCDYPVDLTKYIHNNDIIITSDELLNEATIVNENLKGDLCNE